MNLNEVKLELQMWLHIMVINALLIITYDYCTINKQIIFILFFSIWLSCLFKI
jgi:hypothetical protein